MNYVGVVPANIGVITLLLLSTLFFIDQHTTGISWDFSVYVLNAQYIFNGGQYFEWERPPLMPFMLFLFSFGGYLLAEYLYIIFTSTLFAYACVKLAVKTGLDKNLFYAVMLSPFVLNYGFMAGTELLALSLLMLSIALIHERMSSALLGLSILARYASVPYLLLILFERNVRGVLLGLGVIAVLFAPWLGYNYLMRGHPFYSLVSSYFFNMISKYMGFVGPGFESIPVPLWIYVPLALLGVCLAYRRGFREIDYITLVFAGLTLFSYWNLTVREIRYLFNLTLPVSYFAAYSIENLVNKADKYKKPVLFVLIISMNFTATYCFIKLSLPLGFYEGADAVKGECMVMSNAWPQLNYIGVPSQPYPPQSDVRGCIGDGKRILLYLSPKVVGPEYRYSRKFIETLPIIVENQYFILLGNESVCAPKRRVDMSYIDYYNGQGYDVRLCPLLPLICST